MNHQKSIALFNKGTHYMPGGVNSPVRAFKNVGGQAPVIHRGEGAHLIDIDNNRYIDYVNSWGPLILGHAHPEVINAVKQALANGTSFGAPCELELKLATKICDIMPNIDKIRFVNSGTEATMTAIRLARGFTQRDKIIKFEGCYHGHADALLVKAGSGALTLGVPSSPGVPAATTQDTLVARFNDLNSVNALFEKHSREIAAIIVEPMAGNMNFIPATAGFLNGLRELCNRHQSLLIFDEVMTGFRVALQGAQSLYKIIPDLTTLGKVIGGGMPVGALGGKSAIMDQLAPQGSIYQAGTLSGNPVCMAAGLATLEIITEQEDFFPILSEKNQQLMNGLELAAKENSVDFRAMSEGAMFGLYFSREIPDSYEKVMVCNTQQFVTFFNHMLEQGIYLAPSPYEAGFISIAHTDVDIKTTIAAAQQAFKKIRES